MHEEHPEELFTDAEGAYPSDWLPAPDGVLEGEPEGPTHEETMAACRELGMPPMRDGPYTGPSAAALGA